MAILDTVKQALGIFYTEPTKDSEISAIISGAKDFLLGAGVPSAYLADDSETPQAVQAIITYAKMAINTDPVEMRPNPMLVAMISQMRAVRETTETTSTEEDQTTDENQG